MNSDPSDAADAVALRQAILVLAKNRGSHRRHLKDLASVLAKVHAVSQLRFLWKYAIKKFGEPSAVSSLTVIFLHLARLFQANPGIDPNSLDAVHYAQYYTTTSWDGKPHIHEVREEAARQFRHAQTYLNERKGLKDAEEKAIAATAIPLDAPLLPPRKARAKPEIDPVNYRRLQKWLLTQNVLNRDHKEALHLKASILWSTGWRGDTVRKLLDSDIQELGNGQIRISPSRSMNKVRKRDGPCEHFENPARILAWRDELRHRKLSPQNLLFPVLAGPTAGLEDSPQNMTNAYKGAGKQAKCTIVVTPHTFRRAHDTAICAAPHGTLSDATRAHVWGKIQMTKIYDRTGNRHIVEAYLHLFAAEGMPIEGMDRCRECHAFLEASQQRCDLCGCKTSVEGFQAAGVDSGNQSELQAAFGVEAASAVQRHLRRPDGR
ncbi:MAG: hypothetical protein LC623_08810 [Halobacteriales archaeon]|nr:hypothetical protein [Halobacteriales archaeon]